MLRINHRIYILIIVRQWAIFDSKNKTSWFDILNEKINLDDSLIIGEVYRSVFSPAVKGIESSYKKGVMERVKQYLHLNGDTVGWEPTGANHLQINTAHAGAHIADAFEDRRTDRRILQSLIVHHKTFDQVFLKPIEYWADRKSLEWQYYKGLENVRRG